MRQVWTTRAGGPEVLEVREAPDPRPGPGEVRVRVQAAGLNFADVMARQGLYPDAPKLPCVMGYEVAGVVDEVGAGADAELVGAEVIALTHFGGQSDVVCVPEAQVLKRPAGMAPPVAAAIPVNYVTAYHMLFRVAHLRPGAHVLVHMAAGGVGIAALQLCRTVPDVVTYGTASAGKHEVLRAEGCTHPIDYRSTDYAAEVRRLTGGRGVDLVLDPLGGRDWRTGMKLLAPVGHLIAYGFANIAQGDRRRLSRVLGQGLRVPLLTPLGLMAANRSVSGVNIGHLWGEVPMLREELRDVLALWQDGRMAPRVDGTFPFEGAGAAHQRMTRRENVGKVVLVP